MCKVSVLIPVCNMEAYLRECLNSIVGQKLREIEIICINDGSTDGSLQILREYQAEDHRIQVIDKPNTGYGHSMNMGLKAANGEYIGILESDDFAETEMFSTLYDTAARHKAEIVKSNFFCHAKSADTFMESLQGKKYNTLLDVTKENLYFATPIWSGIYKREFLLQNDIWFNETPGASFQDMSFGFKSLICAQRLLGVKAAFVHYRIDNESSSVHSKAKVFCICDEFKEIWRFINSRPELKTKFQYRVPFEQYVRYMETFHRIDEKYQSMFLRRMSDEFSVLSQQGFLREKYWPDKASWNHVQEIIQKPGEIYYERYVKSQNAKLYIAALEAMFRTARRVYVYGAGKLGRKAVASLRGKGIVPAGVLVTSMENNPASVLGVEVQTADTVSPASDSILLIAIRKEDQYDVLLRLDAFAWGNIIVLDAKAREALQI